MQISAIPQKLNWANVASIYNIRLQTNHEKESNNVGQRTNEKKKTANSDDSFCVNSHRWDTQFHAS